MNLLILLFLSYYAACQNLADSALKSALADTIITGERYAYGTNQYHSSNNPPLWEAGDLKSYGTWQFFPATDMTEDGIVWDMYSNSVRYYPYEAGASGCGLNIEHCLPKSWWGAEACMIAYQDLFNLNPSDQQANSQKSNYAPGHVVRGDKFDNGSFRMDSKTKSQYGWICFEPAPEYRGDFARSYFYMATAYGDSVTWGSAYSDFVVNDSYLEFTEPIINVLLDWHRSDPVSAKEVHRAATIAKVQHNHNPFIDYPELVEFIWGNRRGEEVDFNTLTCMFDESDTLAPIRACYELLDVDTLIYLPAVTKSKVNALPNGFASDRNGATGAGTAAMTMGTSTDDGWISFSNLNLTDSAVLIFRASPFQTASSMQLDVYADTTLLQSFIETVTNKTRYEKYYEITIPSGTDSITIASVGGATTKRASMQELYLVRPRHTITAIEDIPTNTKAQKVFRNGELVIIVDGRTYNLLGQ